MKSHSRPLLTLGLPIVIGQVGTIVLGLADTLMVGHHSMHELAAASFVNTILNLFVFIALGYSYGITPIIGALFGSGSHHEIGRALRTGVLANLLLGGVLVAVLMVLWLNLDKMGQPAELLPLMRPYMLIGILSMPFVCVTNAMKQFYDAIGHTRTSMCVLLTGNVLNIIGNWLLIYGPGPFPEWGLLGAGISTLFSRIVMMLLMFAVLGTLRRYRQYSNDLRRAHVSRSQLLEQHRVGWPVSMQIGMETASFSLTAVMVGWISVEALAAHQIMLSVSQVFFMVYYGLSGAVAVRVSHFNGRGDLQGMRATARAGFMLNMLFAVLVAIPMLLLRNHIGFWFTDDTQVAVLVSAAIIPLLVYQFGDALQCTYSNALRGIAVVRPIMWAALVAYFVVSLPMAYVMGIRWGWGLTGVWWSFPMGLTLAGIIYWLIFRRELAKR